MAKSPEEALATMIDNLPRNTGKTLAQWLVIAKSSGRAKHGELVNYLKAEHGIGHGYANLVAQRALAPADQPPAGDDALLDVQYSGARAALRKIYDAVIAGVSKFGADVAVSPKKTYVSLRRTKQFALVQPSTATRVDIGINLKGVPPTDRLEPSGSFNAMVTHRVRLGQAADVDQELIGWLKRAYDLA